MEIKKLADTVQGSGNFLLYATSGAGKTFSLSTLPPGETLILAVEKGLRTLVDIMPDVDVVEINSIQNMRDAYPEIAESNYKIIAIDSISELAELALTEAKAMSKDGRQHYMIMADTIGAIIHTFNELPQTVIYTAQEERVNQEDLGLLDYVIGPAIPGRKFSTKVPYKFDFVFCLRTRVTEEDEIERRFQTGLHGDYLAKSRTQRLELFEPPVWTEIFNKLEG